MPSLQIAPSLIAADFSCLKTELDRIAGHADLLHVDIMDGHFVPNITFGPFIVARVHQITALPLDVHLMISEPRKYLKDFARAGARSITFHIECDDDTQSTLTEIRALGCKIGLSVKPGTPLEALQPFAGQVDRILIMTVEPGFGGQHFMPEMMPKVALARAWREQYGWTYDIEVDGGLAPATIRTAVEAGAEVIVAGTAVFGQPDAAAAIDALRRAA